MTNYFASVGTKPIIKSDNPFSSDDAKPELLLGYEEQRYRLSDTDLKDIYELYEQWSVRLFNKFNVVVQGRQSKFQLLERYKKFYLDSGQLGHRKVRTVRLHGFTPVTLERFSNGLFGTVGGKSASNKDRNTFLTELNKSETHYIFLIHSFESLYKECKDVCDIIFQLCRDCPEYCHILLSSDHINGGKVLNKLKLQIGLIFYFVPYGHTFFYERTHASLTENVTTNAMIDEKFNLASLEDVHQAMQKSCQQVMVYILRYHVEQSQAQAVQFAQVPLEFNQLFQHCQSKFWLRRSNMLRAHLGELEDHSIVRLEGNKILCLIDLGTCTKFLKSIGDE